MEKVLYFFLRARANLKCYINKLTSVFHASPVIDHEFRHNIVKVTGSTRRWPSGSTDYFDNVMTKFIVYNWTDP